MPACPNYMVCTICTCVRTSIMQVFKALRIAQIPTNTIYSRCASRTKNCMLGLLARHRHASMPKLYRMHTMHRSANKHHAIVYGNVNHTNSNKHNISPMRKSYRKLYRLSLLARHRHASMAKQYRMHNMHRSAVWQHCVTPYRHPVLRARSQTPGHDPCLFPRPLCPRQWVYFILT